MTREEFFESITTQETGVVVNLAKGATGALLQIGVEGNFAPAYLSDRELSNLRIAIGRYLALKEDS